MNDPRAAKLQYLLITQLLKNGSVELTLPDGITLEIGITQEDEWGQRQKTADYCYVVAKKDTKVTTLDSYNMGLQFEEEGNTIVCESEDLNDEGRLIHRMEVV